MTYLDRILDHKREQLRALRGSARAKEIREAACETAPERPAGRRFRERVSRPGGPHLIAELKKASPSKGLLRPDYDPVRFARRYEESGASAISCLTDERFFQGSIEHLRAVRGAVALPLLRKDFILDPLQILEAKAAGADAILLIVAALERAQLEDLSFLAAEEGLDVLVEVHDEAELEAAFSSAAPPALLGVNNRNLKTFEVSLETTERLARRTPPGVALVGESGVERRADVERLGRAGACAALVGETLMRRADPGEAVRELLGLADEKDEHAI